MSFFRPLGKRFNTGWEALNITTLTSGTPFSVYSGIQQTGVGSGGADRPDQISAPVFSTSRTIREDYFGRGADNASFFSTLIGVPGGTSLNLDASEPWGGIPSAAPPCTISISP